MYLLNCWAFLNAEVFFLKTAFQNHQAWFQSRFFNKIRTWHDGEYFIQEYKTRNWSAQRMQVRLNYKKLQNSEYILVIYFHMKLK